jgi:diguanylate cyclase (GGDEF)-like protein
MAVLELLGKEIARAQRDKTPLSLVYFDVDDFKQVNDTHGHVTGDGVLRKVGETLLTICREADMPIRYGGDEFCVLLPNTLLEEAKVFCGRLISEFQKQGEGVSLSIGVAQTGPLEYMSIEQIIKVADAKMYEAKKHQGFHIAY